MNWEGVWFMHALNAMLKFDRDEKPDLSAMASMVK
jgi:hypothetical protein